MAALCPDSSAHGHIPSSHTGLSGFTCERGINLQPALQCMTGGGGGTRINSYLQSEDMRLVSKTKTFEN